MWCGSKLNLRAMDRRQKVTTVCVQAPGVVEGQLKGMTGEAKVGRE